MSQNDNSESMHVAASSSSAASAVVPLKRSASDAIAASPRQSAALRELMHKRVAATESISRKRPASESSTTTKSEERAHHQQQQHQHQHQQHQQRFDSVLLPSLAVTSDSADVAVRPIGGVPAHVWLNVLPHVLAAELRDVQDIFWLVKQCRVTTASIDLDVSPVAVW